MTATRKNKKALKEVATNLLEEGKSIRIEASGYSMYPAVKPGNTIHIDPVHSPDEIVPGGIIAWKREEDLVVHRVIYRYSSNEEVYFITRGDSSPSSDEPISARQVAGRVMFVESGNRRWIPVSKMLIRERIYWWNRLRVLMLVGLRKVFRP